MTIEDVARRYAVAVSPTLLSLVDPADPHDPIARQFLPSLAELNSLPQELADPIGDAIHSPVSGIVHRHAGRVLFKIVSACPVYCRFCFRRETVGPGRDSALSPADFEAALAYIAAHREIREVILTGGDPFILSARRIAEVSARLGAIAHVKIVRWHTRVPVTDPDRVSDPLVSQSVLLKGVNDDAETLAALMRAFADNRIKPYYLHHPDLAPGTSHFRNTIPEGLALMQELRLRLSGLEMPTYMLDIPGGYGKVPLESGHLEISESGIRLRDLNGRWHAYAD